MKVGLAQNGVKMKKYRKINVLGLNLETAVWWGDEQKSPIVLLHEGLGCIAMWREFPKILAQKTNRTVIAYSRAGYGFSEPYANPKKSNYLHAEAQTILPAFLEKMNIQRPILFGHSDGGSIALIYAATYPQNLSALIVLAPHEFLEEKLTQSLEKAVYQFTHTKWAHKLGKYHADPVRVFNEWSGVWLSDLHQNWNIVEDLQKITVPTLAIQGAEDEYATLKQVEIIAEKVPHARLVVLDSCRHSPQFDARDRVLGATSAFLDSIS